MVKSRRESVTLRSGAPPRSARGNTAVSRRSTYKHPASARPVAADPRRQLTPPISRGRCSSPPQPPPDSLRAGPRGCHRGDMGTRSYRAQSVGDLCSLIFFIWQPCVLV